MFILYRLNQMIPIYSQRIAFIAIAVNVVGFLIYGMWSLSRLKTATKNIAGENCYTTTICNEDIDFNNFSNNISGFPYPIVPDIVHLIYFRTRELRFSQMVTLRSIIQHHNPQQILLHCSECVGNKTMEGKYWDMLGKSFQSRIEIVPIEEPKMIFGQKLSNAYHASDIARINILMKYGGIFLDNDVYVVKGLHGFRHFEMAMGWEDRGVMGTQVLIAHKSARFLPLWLDSYHNYKGEEWYFNAGEYPTTEIINKRPEILHMVKHLFGVSYDPANLYNKSTGDWKDVYTIHLLVHFNSDKKIKVFDENNIKTYPNQFGQIFRYALYGSPDIVH